MQHEALATTDVGEGRQQGPGQGGRIVDRSGRRRVERPSLTARSSGWPSGGDDPTIDNPGRAARRALHGRRPDQAGDAAENNQGTDAHGLGGRLGTLAGVLG